MNNVSEISKVEFNAETGFYQLMILSAAIGKWICQGEYTSKKQAEIDRKMF
jgi:hypothetical protein